MNWKEKNGSLHKHFEFTDFREAFAFMKKVAEIAEKHNHHPRIENEYKIVDLYLSTHDAGGSITDKDYALADDIDTIKQL